jgi:hypothetical protein
VNREIFLDEKPFGKPTNVFQFAGTGGWSSEKSDWKNVYLCGPTGALRVALGVGEHKLMLRGLGGGLNLDWLRLVPATGKNAINPNPTLVDSKLTGIPEDWSFTPPPDGKLTQMKLASVDGKSTLTLADRDSQNGLGLQQIIPISAGKTYRESARLKGSDINFYFVWLDKDKKMLGKEIIQTMKAGKEKFEEIGWEQKAPEGAEFLKYWIYSARGAQGETQIQEPALEEVAASQK